MVERILDHPNITVLTGTDFADIEGIVKFDRLIFTGPIDAFFGYMHGPLPYRSLRFELEYHDDAEFFQEAAQINFPNEHAYTRITEMKHATGQLVRGTTISREYPQPYVRGENEPYYPVPMHENRRLYDLYAAEARKLAGSTLFAGRLADYQYYNMDQAVARALAVFEKEVCPV
jgi:UDP-galactopyranose mutase